MTHVPNYAWSETRTPKCGLGRWGRDNGSTRGRQRSGWCFGWGNEEDGGRVPAAGLVTHGPRPGPPEANTQNASRGLANVPTIISFYCALQGFYGSRVNTNTERKSKYSYRYNSGSSPPVIPVGIMEMHLMCVLYIEGNRVKRENILYISV